MLTKRNLDILSPNHPFRGKNLAHQPPPSHLHHLDRPHRRSQTLRNSPPSADEKTAQHLQAMLTGSNNQEWKLKPLGLSNVSSVVLNPYIIEQSDCTFGCLGHLCDAADSCSPDLLCKNSVCQPYPETQPGRVGERCNSKAVCQSHLRCDEKQGTCQACSARSTIQPAIEKRKRTIEGDMPFTIPPCLPVYIATALFG